MKTSTLSDINLHLSHIRTRFSVSISNHVTLPSNVLRGKEETEALAKIFRWQTNGLKGLPVFFLVAKNTTLYLREENIILPVPERGEL
jgi:hypothetical protein